MDTDALTIKSRNVLVRVREALAFWKYCILFLFQLANAEASCYRPDPIYLVNKTILNKDSVIILSTLGLSNDTLQSYEFDLVSKSERHAYKIVDIYDKLDGSKEVVLKIPWWKKFFTSFDSNKYTLAVIDPKTRNKIQDELLELSKWNPSEKIYPITITRGPEFQGPNEFGPDEKYYLIGTNVMNRLIKIEIQDPRGKKSFIYKVTSEKGIFHIGRYDCGLDYSFEDKKSYIVRVYQILHDGEIHSQVELRIPFIR